MALRKYRKALRYLDECWEKDGIDEGELAVAVHLFTCYDDPAIYLLAVTGLKSASLIIFFREKCIIAKSQVAGFHK